MNKAERAVAQYELEREKAVLKELEQHYEYALNGINERLRMLQSAPETQSKVYQKQYQETLKKQVSAILERLHSDTYSSLDQYRHDAYTTGFVGTMYDMHSQDVPLLIPINQDAVLKAVQHDTLLTSPLYDELGIDTKKMSRSISKELSRGLASGMIYDDIARNIKNTTKAPLARAKLIARTEGHRIQQASSQDAREAAKERGAEVVKQWDATLDGDTRPNHRMLDGQIREVDEPFEVGGYTPMHPGDFGEASEDCNCRCMALTRARWALDEDELKVLRERAVRHSLYADDPKAFRAAKLPALKSFPEFQKSYLKAAEEEAKIPSFVPAKSIEEAERAIAQYCNDKQFGALGVSYKGLSLEVANEVNRTLVPLYSAFDVDMMGGIVAPAGNTKLGKQISGALAGYMPVRKSFVLNRQKFKSIKAAEAAFEGESMAIRNLLEHPEQYDFTKLPRRILEVVERSKVSGRSTVPRTIEEALQHEFGHVLERKVLNSALWADAEKNMAEYADRISGYAGESKGEYIAESFVSFMKGEGLADPVLVQIFESLRRK